MSPLRALWRLLRAVLHLLRGMAIMAALFSRLDDAGRQRHIQAWSRQLLALMGLELRVSGTVRPGAALVVVNHVSWLDIAAVHAVLPQARFVSKADVLAWPLVGWLIKTAGTLFIERERKRDALRVVHHTAAALREGHSVAMFPEGTVGPGPELLPFHANLLQAAISAEAPVQPVVLRFSQPGQRFSEAVQYLGDTTLLQSFWRIACTRGLVVHVQLLPAQGSRHADRRALAELLRAQMAAALAASDQAN